MPIFRTSKLKIRGGWLHCNVKNCAVFGKIHLLQFWRQYDVCSFTISLHLCISWKNNDQTVDNIQVKDIFPKRHSSSHCICTVSLLVFSTLVLGKSANYYPQCIKSGPEIGIAIWSILLCHKSCSVIVQESE